MTPNAKRVVALLVMAGFLSMLDRALLPPVFAEIADDLGVTQPDVSRVFTVYVIAYAILQIPWAMLSMRWGRVRVLALSASLGGLASLATAVLPGLDALLVTRAVGAAAFAATVPAVLVYIGDALPFAERAPANAGLAAALALGMTAGTLGATLAAELLHWRVAYAAAGVLAVAVGIALLRAPDTHRRAEPILPAFARLVRLPWAFVVLLLTFIEGVALVGVFAFLATALIAQGEPLAVAGATTAVYGLALQCFALVARQASRRLPAVAMLAVGGVAAVAAFALLTVAITPVTVAVAAVLVAVAWSFGHTTMQAWMTDAVSVARAPGMALFAIVLFLGASAGSLLGSLAVHDGAFRTLFGVAAVIALVFAAGAVVLRARYRPVEA